MLRKRETATSLQSRRGYQLNTPNHIPHRIPKNHNNNDLATHNTSPNPLSLYLPTLHIFSHGNRRDSIQHPRHFIGRHLRTLQTSYLATLAQFLQAKGKFPTLTFIDEENVAFAFSISYRGAKDMEVFCRLLARLNKY
jgi:hypothetical protein